MTEPKVNPIAVLRTTDDHLQALQHYGHSHDLRHAIAAFTDLVEATKSARASLHSCIDALSSEEESDHEALADLDAALAPFLEGRSDG